MRMARIIGLAVVLAAALLPAATAAADEPDPLPSPADQLPGESLPDGPVAGDPAALPATSCAYVVESGLYTCDARITGRLAAATTVVATLYPAKAYIGAPTLTVRSEKGGCTSGKLKTELRVDLRYLYFTADTHWDDKAMSFRTYAGCRLKLYDGTDGVEGRLPATTWLDDRASMTKVDGHLWARRADLIALS